MSDSPCVGICRLDAGGRTCLGCGRTLAEIARWMEMGPAERGAVLARLAALKSQNAGEEAQRDEAEK